MEEEYLCLLHSNHKCKNRDYQRGCAMKESSGFAKVSCKYRFKAVVLAAAEKMESPANVVQQGQPEKTADTMEAEIKDIF
jgi:hypothetical protein